jgi:CubicO group peptidase (beta-lactamase class C family)
MSKDQSALPRRTVLGALSAAGMGTLVGTGATARAGTKQEEASPDDPSSSFITRGTERIEQLFEHHLEQGLHHGAQLTVYRGDELVVDLAGGTLGPDRNDAATDSRFFLFSCTKPYAAACIHHLADQGELRFDDPVVEHWPTFAQERTAKEAVTVRHVLTHQAGLPVVDADDNPDIWNDPDALAESVETADLDFQPGETAEYHTLSFGWLVGELVRQITDQRIDQYARDNIFGPLNMDRTHIGLPDDEPHDVTTLVGFELTDKLVESEVSIKSTNEEVAELFNRESVRRSLIPGANGVGPARELARFYACYLNGGELDGTRILEPETVAEATSVQVEVEPDETVASGQRYGLGFQLGGALPNRHGIGVPATNYGHAGLGSSISWADPEVGLAFAYVTNGIRDDFEHNARMSEMGEAVRHELT